MYIFEIYGVPPVQKQTRHCTKNGRSWSFDPSKKDKERIQWQIRPTAPEKPLTGPVELTIALKELVYADDKQICGMHVFKFYGETPKTVIKVRPILQIEEVGYHACDI